MEWEEKNICQLCDTISETYKDKSDEVVLINTSDVFDGKCLNHKHVPNKKLKGQFKKTFQKGDILYSEIRPANKRFCYVDFEPKNYIASTKLMVLRSNEDVDSQYLYQILRSNKTLIQLQELAESRSGTFPQITYSELSNIIVSVPSINAQKNIVDLLSSLDRKIELNNRVNAALEEMAQAIFKNWFVDFEPFKDGKFKDSELGRIPEGWEVGKIEGLFEFQNGFAFSSKDFSESGEHKIITIKSVQDGNLISEGSSKITEYPVRMPTYCKLQNGDILLSLMGNVGRSCLVTEKNLLLNQRVAKIKAKECYDHSFAYALFRLKETKELLISISRGTAQANLSPIEASKLPMVIPSEYSRKKFSIFSDSIMDKIISIQIENRALSHLRDTLLPRLMSGEIEIPE